MGGTAAGLKIDLKRINGPRMGKNKGERKLSPFSFGNVRSRLQTAGEREKKRKSGNGFVSALRPQACGPFTDR